MPTPRVNMEYSAATVSWRAMNGALRGLQRGLFGRDASKVDPTRLVVHLIGNIGDIVVAIPVLIGLRDRFPDAHISLLTSPGKRGMPGAAQLLSGVSFLDRMYVYHSDEIDTPRKQIALAKTVRGWRPELMVFLPSSRVPAKTVYRNLAFARLCAPHAVFNYQVPASPWFKLSQARVRDRFPHEVDRHLTALKPLGVSSAARFEFGAPPSVDARRACDLTSAAADRPILAVCPGGKQDGHLWPVARFAQVCQRAARELAATIWIIGGKGDSQAAEGILASVPEAVDLTGSLSLLGSVALLARADVLLSNDTGPMHLGAAAGTRVCAIFSSQNYVGRWYPYGSGHTVFRTKKACPECLFNDQRTLHCVGKISVDDVAAACLEVLSVRHQSRQTS